MSSMHQPNSRDEKVAANPSLADTVREHYTKVCHCGWSEDEFTRTVTSEHCSIHGSVPDPLDALVDERDRLLAFVDAVSPFVLDVLDEPFPWQRGGQVVVQMTREEYDEAVAALEALRE